MIKKYPGTCLVIVLIVAGLCNDHNLAMVGL